MPKLSTAILPVLFALLVGCGPQDEPRGPSSAPAITFEQQSASRLAPGPLATDAPMLVGTTFLLGASDPSITSGWVAESTDKQIVTIAQTVVACGCNSRAAARTIQVHEGCRIEEERSCRVSIFGKAHGPGIATIDVLDRRRGALVQQLPVRVAKAATIQPLVYVADTDAGPMVIQRGNGLAASDDGLYDVPIGHAVHVSYVVRDEAGDELHGFSGGVAIQRPAGDAFGIETEGGDVLQLRAVHDGTSTIVIATDEAAVDAAIGATAVTATATLRAR